MLNGDVYIHVQLCMDEKEKEYKEEKLQWGKDMCDAYSFSLRSLALYPFAARHAQEWDRGCPVCRGVRLFQAVSKQGDKRQKRVQHIHSHLSHRPCSHSPLLLLPVSTFL